MAARPVRAPGGEAMKIGYVHVGPKTGGIARFSRLIAAEVAGRPDHDVVEFAAELGDDHGLNVATLKEAARRFDAVDLVHVQYSKYAWGPGRGQVSLVRGFLSACRAPLAVTFHDVYVGRSVAAPYRVDLRLRRAVGRWLDPSSKVVPLLVRSASLVIVNTTEEKRRLAALTGDRSVRVIPHFVEDRSPVVSASVARRALGLNDRRIVTLLGFIHSRKGYPLLLEALRRLPPDVLVVFAGGAPEGREEFASELEAMADRLGVADRMRITGYLSEDQLNQHLFATHLAVCPFQSVSASGSLSTWVSAGRPILATDLPLIAEYNARVPDAIKTFKPYSAEALADAIAAILPTCTDEPDPAIVRLRDDLALPRIVDHHLQLYESAKIARHGGRQEPRRPTRVTFLPWFEGNPYQSQLAEHLGDLGVRVTGVDSSVLSLPRVMLGRRPDVLHLHWLHPYTQASNILSSSARWLVFRMMVAVLRLRGTRIVWTVHNLQDHEAANPRLDRMCASTIAQRASGLIVHGSAARRAVESRFGRRRDQHVVEIRHGHYFDCYPASMDRSVARARLGLSEDDLVYLFLGRIRPYKGVLELIDAFRRLDESAARLVIAGLPRCDVDTQLIRQRVEGDARIVFAPGFVPDEEIQVYMNGADVVVLPYRDILTSGAAILAMSFGRACIAPRLDFLTEVLDDQGGFFYDVGDEAGILGALRSALDRRDALADMGSHNRDRAATWDWPTAARVTQELYGRVLDV